MDVDPWQLLAGAAIFGSVYKVTAPTIWAPYAAFGVAVLGGVLTVVFPGRASSVSSFEPLVASEQKPQKL